MWNPSPALSSTVRVRQAARSRLGGAAKAEPAYISAPTQRGQVRSRRGSYRSLYETRQDRQTYEVFAGGMGTA